MATAGEGTASAGTSTGYEGGGAGGKLRKKPLRRNQTTTPYDRPPTALRNPSWISKLLVEPALKLITSGAQLFFSSIFTKRLTAPPSPPPPPPGPSQESKDVPQESRPSDFAGALVVAGQGGNAACSSRNDTFSELEQLLRQKTFTRTEIDRLTELLRSKAVDMPIANEEKRSEVAQSRSVLDLPCSLPEENRSLKVTSSGVVATPVTSSRFLEDDIASPAELAKAYMGSRPSKVSPSMLSMRTQAVREDTPLLKNIQYAQKSPILSATTRTSSLLGVRENGFTTPRSRARSAIYNMARTPYSRVRQTDFQKASSSTDYVHGGMQSSQAVSEHDGPFGSKQALKRRSYVMDDDLGSVGPMRRIRQKANLPSRGDSRSSVEVASSANLHRKVSEVVADDQDNKTTPKRHVAIPPKSSETAAKILEHLEKMTPKGKSSEKLAAGKDRTPINLTPNMPHGQAFKSLGDSDSPKLLLSAQDSYKLDNWSKLLSPNPRESKRSETEQNGHKVSVSESTFIAKNDSIFSSKDAQAGVGINFLDANSSDQPLQKKRAFKMSAHENSFELEEDRNSYGLPCQLAEGRGKLKIFDAGQKSVSAAEPMNKHAALLEERAPLGVLDKKTDSGTPDIGAITANNAIFLPNASSGLLNVNQPLSVSHKSKEATVDKIPSSLFSSSIPFAASKPESSSSLSNVYSSPTEARPNRFELDNLQKVVDSNGKLEAFSSGPSTISTSAIFSFSASSSTASLSNGLFAPNPVISATCPLASSNCSLVAPLTNITNTMGTTAGSLFGSGATSSVSEQPTIKFGSPGVPPTTDLELSTTSTGDVKAKAEIGTSFGNPKTSPFTGSMPVHFGSSASSPSLGNFPPSGFASGTTGQASASGIFAFGASSSVDTSTGPSNGTTPVAFTFGASSSARASETSAPSSPGIFSFSGSSSASSTNAIKISGNTTPDTFNIGDNSSSSFTNTVNTSATPAVFSFGSKSSASPTNAVNTQTSAAPGIFSFGATSSASLTNATSLTNASTTVSPNTFAFGASSQTSSAVGMFGLSGQPTQSPPGFSSPFSSSTPSGFAFGASSSFATPSTTTPVVFGSTPPSASTGSGFLFGSTNSTSQPVFGNSISAFAAPPGNNDNMEDSMAEDPVQASTSFGQPSVSPSPGGFAFISTPPSQFRFSGQQNQAASQNSSPFAASGSLDFGGGGGSFSLGSSGPDKSGRRIVKVNRSKLKRR